MKKSLIALLVFLCFLTSCSNKDVVTSIAKNGSDIEMDEYIEENSNKNNVPNEEETVISSSSDVVSNNSSSEKELAVDSQVGSESEVDDGLTYQAKRLGLTEEILKRSIVSEGDRSRIANVMRKAMKGDPVTVGVIGGSITQGTAASSSESCYASILKAWWKETFPKSTLTFVNAGLGATGSLIGVHRITNDLLSKKPDFVVVEYAVNDPSTDLCQETYEGVIRRILKQENNAAVLLLFTMEETGRSAQEKQQQIGKNYNLPMVSYRDAIYPETQRKYKWDMIAADGVHPNDVGHAIIGELLKYYLTGLKNDINSISGAIKSLETPYTANRYENAILYTNQNITPSSLGGFSAVNDAFVQFKNGWRANSKGAIVFEVKEATNIHLMFRVTTSGHGGVASVKLDGEQIGTVNSDFSGGWGDYSETFEILTGNVAGNHTVEIELLPQGEKNEFTILGILKS